MNSFLQNRKNKFSRLESDIQWWLDVKLTDKKLLTGGICTLRILITLGAFLRFWLNSDSPITAFAYLVLGSLFVYTGIITISSIRSKDIFIKKRFVTFQILADTIIFSLLYYLTGKSQSDLFLFYFLPLLVTAEFIDNIIETIIIFFLISTLSIAIMLLIPWPDAYTLFDVIIRVVTPRITFFFGVFFIAIIRRRLLAQQQRTVDALTILGSNLAKSGALPASPQILDKNNTLQDFLDLVLKSAIILIRRADRGSIYLLDLNAEGEAAQLLHTQALLGHSNEYTMKIGEGIVGRAVKDNKVIYSPDFQKDPRVVQTENKETKLIKSCVCVPIRLDETVYGSLCVDSTIYVDAFSQLDITLLETLALQATVAINNSRLYHRVRRQIWELEEIHNTVLEATALQEYKSRMRKIVSALTNLLNAEGAFVFLFNQPDTDVLSLVAIEGTHNELEDIMRCDKFTIKSDEGLAGKALKSRKTIIASHNSEQEGKIPGISEYYSSVIISPLITEDNVIGVIGAFADSQKRLFTFKLDVPVLERLAQQASLAIFNSNLLERTQVLLRETEELSRVEKYLLEIAEATQKESTVEDNAKEISTIVLNNLKSVLEFDEGTVQIISDNSRQLIASSGIESSRINKGWLLRDIDNDRLVKKVLDKQELIILSDTHKSKLWDILPETKRIRSWIGIPLVYRREGMGLITLASYRVNHYQNLEQKGELRDIFTIFSNITATALKNSLLHLINRQRIEELTKLQDRLEDSENLAMIGLLYGEDIHFNSNKLGAARQFAKNIIERAETIEYAQEKAEMIYKIIGSVLDMIRAMFEYVDPPRSNDFNVHGCIEDILKRTQRANKIEVIKRYEVFNPIVFGYKRQLTQVFRVVIYNAVEAMNGRGRLTISTEEIVNDNNIPYISISISDTGPGIPEEEQPYLFQLGKSDSEAKRSFGIGLAWSRLFLKRYGGDISFETKKDSGTIFRILVPRDYRQTADTSILE